MVIIEIKDERVSNIEVTKDSRHRLGLLITEKGVKEVVWGKDSVEAVVTRRNDSDDGEISEIMTIN